MVELQGRNGEEKEGRMNEANKNYIFLTTKLTKIKKRWDNCGAVKNRVDFKLKWPIRWTNFRDKANNTARFGSLSLSLRTEFFVNAKKWQRISSPTILKQQMFLSCKYTKKQKNTKTQKNKLLCWEGSSSAFFHQKSTHSAEHCAMLSLCGIIDHSGHKESTSSESWCKNVKWVRRNESWRGDSSSNHLFGNITAFLTQILFSK